MMIIFKGLLISLFNGPRGNPHWANGSTSAGPDGAELFGTAKPPSAGII